MENTLFGKQLTELLETCEGADVTLNCMGEVFKAHSYILAMRCYLFYHPSESALSSHMTSQSEKKHFEDKSFPQVSILQNQIEH